MIDLLSLPLPRAPYRGIEPFRLIDWRLFHERTDELEAFDNRLTMYRGVLLYGESGTGKTSLLNAAVLPYLIREKYWPERVRLQPRPGSELVVERIPIRDIQGEGQRIPTDVALLRFLPSRFSEADSEERVLCSCADFNRLLRRRDRLREQEMANRQSLDQKNLPNNDHTSLVPLPPPVLIFDQFEEYISLFDEAPVDRAQFDAAQRARRAIDDLLVQLLTERSDPLKIIFAFRDDYLAKLRRLFLRVPNLTNQSVELAPFTVANLPRIIRGPFELSGLPGGHFKRRLSEAALTALQEAFEELSENERVNPTEVQIACLALWSDQGAEQRFIEEENSEAAVRRLFGNYLDRALARLNEPQREPAITVLVALITARETRNIVSEDDLLKRIDKSEDFGREGARELLKTLADGLRLVFRQNRGDTPFYELASEFLIPRIRELHQNRGTQLELADARVSVEKSDRDFRLVSNQFRSISKLERARRRWQRGLAAAVGIIGVLCGLLMAILSQQRALTESIKQSKQQLQDAYGRLEETATERNQALAELRKTTDLYEDKLHKLQDSLPVSKLEKSQKREREARELLNTTPPDFAKLTMSKANLVLSRQELETISTDEMTSELREHFTTQMAALNAVIAATQDRLSSISNGQAPSHAPNSVLDLKEACAPLKHDDQVWSVEFGPAGTPAAPFVLTASSDHLAKLWKISDGTSPPGSELRARDGLTMAVFSPDGLKIAAAGADGVVYRVDLTAGKALSKYTGHLDTVTSVAFSPDSSKVCTASADQTARAFLWANAVTGFRSSAFGDVVTYSASNHLSTGRFRILCSCDNGKIRLYSYEASTKIWEADLGAPVHRAIFSPRDRWVVGASGYRGFVLSADDGDQRAMLEMQPKTGEGRATPVWHASFAPDENLVILGCGDGTAHLWQVNPPPPSNAKSAVGEEIAVLRFHQGPVRSAAWWKSPIANSARLYVATASEDGTAAVWDLIDPRHPVLAGRLIGHTGRVWSVVFSPDGTLIATCSEDRTARLWRFAPAR